MPDLIIHEKKGFSSDSFKVKDTSGQIIYEGKAKAFSYSDKLALLDAGGNPVYRLQRSTGRSRECWKVYDASGATVLYSVRFKMDWQPRALVYSGDPEFKLFSSKTKDGTQPMWDMSANKAWSDRKLNIRSAADGRLVAESKENRWNLGGLVGQNEYGVSVAEGADAALVCVLIMMMDESAENNS
jgi:uncharacterized protein YxjI